MNITAILVCAILFVGLPWVILHYTTKWRQAPKITEEDERLLDEMHALARRLEERVTTVERIIAADNPEWKPSITAQRTGEEYLIDRRN